jgi:hypothetical protein
MVWVRERTIPTEHPTYLNIIRLPDVFCKNLILFVILAFFTATDMNFVPNETFHVTEVSSALHSAILHRLRSFSELWLDSQLHSRLWWL